VLGTFCRLIEREFDRTLAVRSDGEDAETLIRRFGFHAIDVTPCADGRLSGVIDYILRIPPAVVAYRKSFAGAMFDVLESLGHWETVELRRWREAKPNSADENTRFLKIGVYHYSSVDPAHQGCAAHGSDTARAGSALLERLQQFAGAVQQTHCCGAQVGTLLIGVDTDTDAIRMHVPDAAGAMSIDRRIDNLALYESTRALGREAAKEAIRTAVAECAGVSVDDPHTEGMRWLCAYLLKNNIGEIDAVRAWHGGAYSDRGHTEQLIVVGDAVEDVQLRNLAFQAQMDTVEEGASDLDIGVSILRGLHEPRGLAVPILVHLRYDARIPGAQERAVQRAHRLQTAIAARYAALVDSGRLVVRSVVRAADSLQRGLRLSAYGGALMKICQVEGTLVATARIGSLENRRLLVVKERGSSGKQVAVDPVGCKPGDWVIAVGSSAARDAAGSKDYPSDLTIVGIIDYWDDSTGVAGAR
jgi:carboxysome shell carbonic anhydrase/carboxysome peptide A